MRMTVQIPKKYIEQEVAKYTSQIKSKKPKAREIPKKIITISRQMGTGGRKIAEEVGRRLGCTVWGREILDVLANQSDWDYQARMFEALDEKTQSSIQGLIGNFFGRIDKYSYLYLLPKAVHVISQNDAVILGRGAHMLLPDSFRVRIKGSFENRLKNMMTHENISEKAAKAIIKETDKQRDAFNRDIAHKAGFKDYQDAFDIEVNMDRFDIKEATSIIMHAFALYYYLLKKAK
jgi:cytidylate kinase